MVMTTVVMEVMTLRTAVGSVCNVCTTLYLLLLASVFCGEGTFFCPGYETLCLNTSAICDGKIDCLDHRDEPLSCRSKLQLPH